MHARALALAALILAAPAPAFAAPDTEVQPTPPAAETAPETPSAKTSPQPPATGTGPTSAPVQDLTAAPEQAPQPVQDQEPAAGTDPTPQTGVQPAVPQSPAHSWWATTDPGAWSPAGATEDPSAGTTSGAPAAAATGAAPQESAAQPITSALAPVQATGPVGDPGRVTGVKFLPALKPVTPGTVTYVASPPLGTVTYRGVEHQSLDIALWGTGAAMLLAVVAGVLHTRRVVARRHTV